MKVKEVLRFYFFAESLDKAFDNVILNTACASMNIRGGNLSAERIFGLIREKEELSKLWNYLDGIITALCKEEQNSLKEYAAMRCGIKKLSEDKRKDIKRALMKFSRRARHIESFDGALGLVGKYYCLIVP